MLFECPNCFVYFFTAKRHLFGPAALGLDKFLDARNRASAHLGPMKGLNYSFELQVNLALPAQRDYMKGLRKVLRHTLIVTKARYAVNSKSISTPPPC